MGKQNRTPTHSLCLTAWAFGVPTWRKIKSNTMNYQKLINEAKSQKSVDFQFKGEKFRLFFDWDNDLCLTHYAATGENAWAIYNLNGLKNKLKTAIELSSMDVDNIQTHMDKYWAKSLECHDGRKTTTDLI